MPHHPSPGAIQEAQSLLLKTLGYESEVQRRKRSLPPPRVTAREAAKLAGREGLKLLRQMGRRVDRFLKARRDQSDALLSVVRLREFGVLAKHLPVLPSARTLERIRSRGRVTSAREASLVLSVLHNTQLVALLGQNAEALGRALDAWNPTKPSRRKAR